MTVLCVLGIRFQRMYLHAREMNWWQQFSIVFSFLEDVLGSSSSSDFAGNLTTSDERDFSALIKEEALDQSVANRLSARWELLSVEVWEFCRALPNMIPFIQESLQVGVLKALV